MQENQNQPMNHSNAQGVDVVVQDRPSVIKTDTGAVNGQNKCPKCGATDISLNINNRHLRCNYYRYEFIPEQVNGLQTDNIMGVYFPYMVVDVNGHALLSGEGEHLVRQYKRGTDEHEKTYYDADGYHVEREFDIAIQGLTIESNKDRLNHSQEDKTNNVINAIMPFDIENCVKYNANYLKGFSSEKRDINVEELSPIVEEQAKDVARFAIDDSLKNYNRGVAWQKEEMNRKGQQWKAAYLPVWLYSYQQVKGQKKVLHYVAVNARTKETMGSVPIHLPKLLFVSFLIELFCIFLMLFVTDFDGEAILLSPGVIYYILIYAKYRNQNARHCHELETKKQIGNVRQVDQYVTRRTGLRNSRISGCNNRIADQSMMAELTSIASTLDSIPDIDIDIK